jgi:acyl-CoA reductase-like NAD-dependent aldehyde dehydrogenase
VTALPAYHVPPGLEEGLETTVQRFGPPHDSVELQIPALTPADLTRWIDAIVAARRGSLAGRPTQSIARPLERVARRFLDGSDPIRRTAISALARTGRFPEAMIAHALDHSFGPLTRGGIDRWLAAELGSKVALDRLVPRRDGPERRAHGPEWMLQIYAGNVPGIPVWPLCAALLLKAAVLAKPASREPLLAPLLARAIAEEDPGLGACIAVSWWRGGTAELDRAALVGAPAVLAFGGENAMAGVARAARPDAIVVLHGPRVSVSCLTREALTAPRYVDLARRVARDVALYDQQGCLSPHALYVERGGRVSPGDFASALGEALASEAPAIGASAARTDSHGNPEAAARVQLYRAQAAFEAAQGERGTRVLGSETATGWTVVLEEGARFEPTPAQRTVRVHAVADLEEALAVLGPVARFLEAVALEAPGARGPAVTAALAALGVPRVAAVGRLQQPSPLSPHGGVGFLAPFVRWTSVDPRRTPGAAPIARSGRAGARGAPASRSSGQGSRRAEPRSRRSR